MNMDNGAYNIAIGLGVLGALNELASRTGSGSAAVAQRHDKLSPSQRLQLPKRDFVFPKTRRYPIYDVEHGRLALNYATWPLKQGGTRQHWQELEKVKKAVFARYPQLISWWNHRPWVKARPRQIWLA